MTIGFALYEEKAKEADLEADIIDIATINRVRDWGYNVDAANRIASALVRARQLANNEIGNPINKRWGAPELYDSVLRNE
jgi:hypothetical protein